MKKIVIIGTTARGLIRFRQSLITRLVTKGYTVYAFAIDYETTSRDKVKAFGAIPVGPLCVASSAP